MRAFVRLLVVVIPFAVLHRIAAVAPLAARAALGLGGVLLVAWAAAEAGARWRLPRVTTFLLAGFVVGPAWLGLVREDEISALAFIERLALAPLALRAGAAFRIADRPSGDAPTGWGRFVAGTVVAPFVLIVLVTLSVASGFPLTAHQPIGDALAIALTLAALATAAGPTLVVATLDDAPPGRFGAQLLRVNVLRDVLAVVLFGVCLLVAWPLASPGAVRRTAAGAVGITLGVSVLGGTVLAWLVARYRRVLGGEPTLYLGALCLLAAIAAQAGPVDLTLTMLAAGWWLAQFAPEDWAWLRGPLEAGSAFFVVVAFSLAGAGFDVDVLGEIWPWILLLVGIRAVGLYWGGRWAGRHPLVTPALAKVGWLGLISQGGVALLLAGVARRAFPEWGVSFEALAVALIAVHAVAGPVCLRLAVLRGASTLQGASVDRLTESVGTADRAGTGNGARGLQQ